MCDQWPVSEGSLEYLNTILNREIRFENQLETDLWTGWYRNKYLNAYQGCAASLEKWLEDEEEISSYFDTDLSWQDIPFLLTYSRLIYQRGTARYSEVSRIYFDLQKEFAIADTLYLNFKNIYSAMTKSTSGGAFIK